MPPTFRIKYKTPLPDGEPASLDNLGRFMSGLELLKLATKAISLERIELISYPKQPKTDVDLEFEFKDFGRLAEEEERTRMLQPSAKPLKGYSTAKQWDGLSLRKYPFEERIINKEIEFNSPDSTFPYTDQAYQVTQGEPINLKGFLATLEAARKRDIEFAQNVAASDLLSQVTGVLERYGLEATDENVKTVLAKAVRFHEQSKGKGKRSIKLD